MANVQRVFVVRKGKDFWCYGKKWAPDLQSAICYFTAENAEKKGPGEGKVVAAKTITKVKLLKKKGAE